MPSVVIVANPSHADHNLILDQLLSFNDATAGPSHYEPIAVLLRGDTGDTVGGLWGKVAYDWLFIELLIVPESLRRQGHGSELIKTAEAIGRERGCFGVWLDTHGFQAPGFYRALGYELFGELRDHPRGTSRSFFKKEFV